MGIYIKGMDEIPDDGAVLVVMHDNGKAYIKRALAPMVIRRNLSSCLRRMGG